MGGATMSVAIGAVVRFVFDSIWYGAIAGPSWLKAMDVDKGRSGWIKDSPHSMGVCMLASALCSILQAYVTRSLFYDGNTENVITAFVLVYAVYLTRFNHMLWQGRPYSLILLEAMNFALGTLLCAGSVFFFL